MATLLEYARASTSEALKMAGSDKKGLTPRAADQRLRQAGPNVVHYSRLSRALFLLQFHKPLILILLLLAVLSTQTIVAHIPTMLLAIAVVNIIAYAYLEKSSINYSRTLARLVEAKVNVLRNSRRVQVESNQLVVGDIVLLERGAKIPADLRIIEDESLKLRKADYGSDQDIAPGLALMGMSVTAGQGRGLVVATGPRTVLGHLALGHISRLPQQKLLSVTFNYVNVGLLLALLTAIGAEIARLDHNLTTTVAVVCLAAWLPLGLAVAAWLLNEFKVSRLFGPAFNDVLQCAMTDAASFGIVSSAGAVGLLTLDLPLPVTAPQIAFFFVILQVMNLVAAGTAKKSSGFNQYSYRRAAGFGLLASAVACANFLFFFVRVGLSPDYLDMSSAIYQHAATLTLVTLLFCHYINILYVRSDKQEKFFTSFIWSNKSLVISGVVSLFILLNFLYNPLLQPHVDMQPLSFGDWLSAIVAAVIYAVFRSAQRHTRKHSRRAVLELHKRHGLA